MKRYITSLVLLIVTVCAHAQLFDFSSNNNRYEIGMKFGQMAFNTQYARFGMGVNTLAWGVYLDLNMTAAQHKFDRKFSDTQWNDDEFFNINLGYQIPILPWIRVMPLLGYAQTNEGITDASTINIDISPGEESNSASIYHTYTVTRAAVSITSIMAEASPSSPSSGSASTLPTRALPSTAVSP